MPKRSNNFQRAIFAVQSHLAAGARVLESEELVDLVSGELREVDVCIHGEVGGHDVIVGLECRDHKRRQSIGWVEEMKGKHERLPTDTLILVSGSGFTVGALKKAQSYGIHTVSPGEDLANLGREVKESLDRMWFKAVTARAEGVTAFIDRGDGKEPVATRLPEDVYLFDASGDIKATAKEFAQQVMEQPDLFKEVMRDATGVEKYFTVAVELSGDENQMYVRDDAESPPDLMRVTKFQITGPSHVDVMPYDLRHGALAGTPFAFGGGNSEHFEISYVARDPDWVDPANSGSQTLHVKRTKMPDGMGDEQGPIHAPEPAG